MSIKKDKNDLFCKLKCIWKGADPSIANTTLIKDNKARGLTLPAG